MKTHKKEKDISLEDMEELWAPHEAMRPFFDIKNMSSEKLKAANESMMADLLGEQPKAPPASNLDSVALDLMYAVMQLNSPITRFETYKVMFQTYPWRKKVSKADHMQSTYYLFVHECYIFELRLQKFFNAIEEFAMKKKIDIDVKRIRKETLSLHKKVFGKAVKWRGHHVHQEEFVPRQIKRISLLDTMMMVSSLKQPELKSCWAALQRVAVNDAKKEWTRQCEIAVKSAREILKFAYRRTKPVWSLIAR